MFNACTIYCFDMKLICKTPPHAQDNFSCCIVIEEVQTKNGALSLLESDDDNKN